MIKWINRLLPRWAYLPFTVSLILNTVTYFFSRIITSGFTHHNIMLPVDFLIPIIPSFIVVYFLSYIQWGIGFIVAARESREFCYKYLSAEAIAKFFCLVIFLAFPTTLVRPDVEGTDIFSVGLRFLYEIDSSGGGIADNLFPSIHVLESWFCMRVMFKSKKTAKVMIWINAVFTALVLISVVTLRQHVVVDILGGIAVIEVAILIAKIIRADRLYYRFDAWFKKKFNIDLTRSTIDERILFFGKKAQ